MTHIIAIVGKRATGKTTLAKACVAGKTHVVLADNAFIANEWKGSTTVNALKGVAGADALVWEANNEVPRPMADQVLKWCKDKQVEELYLIVQYEKMIPSALRVKVSETVRLY